MSESDQDRKERLVSYASGSCNLVQRNYGSYEGECLVGICATQHFTEYLIGSPLTLVTYHEPLKWLMQTNKTASKLARWSLLLQEYDFKVRHTSGVLNTNADCLSRCSKSTPVNGIEENIILHLQQPLFTWLDI